MLEPFSCIMLTAGLGPCRGGTLGDDNVWEVWEVRRVHLTPIFSLTILPTNNFNLQWISLFPAPTVLIRLSSFRRGLVGLLFVSWSIFVLLVHPSEMNTAQWWFFFATKTVPLYPDGAFW